MRTLSPPISQILPLCSNHSVPILPNKSTLRHRSTRASQKGRIIKEDPLLVSIKGLSDEEENYVRRQTQLCLTGQPVPVQGRQEELNKLYKKAGVKVRHANLRCPTVVSRCLAMADSFKVEEKDRADFLAFCNQHAEPSTRRRQFHLFDSNPIQRGLLQYSLSPSETAFRDWEAHANMPGFKTKYKEKLNNVIENLGLLEFEEFPEELNESSSFAEFSTNFYRRIMLENCGISDLENLAKNRRKLLELHSSREIRDPVNIVRNYFIFSEHLNVDLDTNLPSLAHLTHTSSLDLLSTLNVLQQSLENIDQATEEEETFSSPSMLHLCLDDQRLLAFPLGLNLRLLHVIGFTQQEIKKLLLHPEMSNKLPKSVLIDFNQIVGEKFGGDVETFCETLRRRLEIIRSEAENLGVKDIFETYKFLVNWEEAMAALDRAAQQQTDVPLLLRFKDTSSEFRNSCRVSLPYLPSSSVSLHDLPLASKATTGQGCEAYLKKLFSLYRSNGERTKAFKATLKRIPHYKEVPATVVKEASEWLQGEEGFTLQQLEKGFPTLLYAVPVLEVALDKADDQLEDGWRKREDALCLVNYFVELESSFNFTSIHEGIGSMIKEQNRLINSEEWEDMETRRGQDFEDWDEDRDEDHEEVEDWTSPAYQQQASRRSFLSPSTSSSMNNMLSSQFSTSSVSFSDEKKGKSKIRIKMASSKVRKDEAFKLDEKLPGLELRPGQVKVWQPQNPFTRLKVWLKFKEIQATWDPSIDQTEFVTGARQAVLTIASILSTGGQWGQLRGLLHRKEHKRLQQVVEKQWSDVERRRLEINEEHLLLLHITDCRLQQINQFKYFDVYVHVMALSPLGDRFVKMNVTFHREYTEGQLPDWIVTKFEVI